MEYFGKKLNPKTVIITVPSSFVNVNNRLNHFLNYPIYFSDVEKIVVESINSNPNPYEEKFREEFLASKYNRNNNITIVSGTTPVLSVDVVINDLL